MAHRPPSHSTLSQKLEHRRACTSDGFTCAPIASSELLSLTCLPHDATRRTTSSKAFFILLLLPLHDNNTLCQQLTIVHSRPSHYHSIFSCSNSSTYPSTDPAARQLSSPATHELTKLAPQRLSNLAAQQPSSSATHRISSSAIQHRSIKASNHGPIQPRHQGHLSAQDPDQNALCDGNAGRSGLA